MTRLDFEKRRRMRHVQEATDATPLIDVVFILLIFFVLAASFAVHGLDLDLPAASSSHAVSGQVIELRLDENGRIYWDEVEKSREEIPNLIDKALRSDAKLLLFAAPSAPVEGLIWLVDEVHRRGGAKLTIATESRK